MLISNEEKKCCKEVPLEQKTVDYKCQGVCKSEKEESKEK
jgi:hypothetical protein|tara:strand:+ start:6848 stop:6967 length:120 start_codon:yes stop_codon:yes gene_type:complete